MTLLSKLAACCFVLLALPLRAQNPETVNRDTVLPDDLVALENQVRHSKFDQVLPGVTELRDLEGNVFRRDPDGVEFHVSDRQPYRAAFFFVDGLPY